MSRTALRLRRSRRARIGALLLAAALLPAIFAEIVAADAPIVAIGPNGVSVLDGVVRPEAYAGLSREAIDQRHAGDLAVWPLLRSGPETRSDGAGVHPLGTDAHGRDVVARLVYGARRALGLGFAAMTVAALLGGMFGALAGWIGGIWDELLSRPVELVQAFPAVLVVALARAIDPELDVWGLCLAIAAVRWAEFARLTRVEVLRLAHEDFVTAGRAIGCGRMRLLRRHVLPHAAPLLLQSVSSGVGAVVLLEVAASFLGIGVDGSWGGLLAEGLEPGAPLGASLWAAGALALTISACQLLADAFGEAQNARVAANARAV